jgi:hypothetical protein
MKFGKLIVQQVRDLEGWPMVQYSTLKKRIKKRLSVEKQQCIFETGTFKRTVRDDMVSTC